MENLKNNSNEMKTQIETFFVEETVDLIYDNDKLDKWNELIGELGLTGQNQITKPDKSPIPFMHLKTSLVNTLETLCPRKVKAHEYNISPIPLEILELIALSTREKYFMGIEIWYDNKSPDPVCVGYTTEYYLYHYKGVPKEAEAKFYPTKQDALNEIRKYDPEFDSKVNFGWEANQQYYLLGKWGDVKASFDELKERARRRYIAEQSNDYKKQIKEITRKLDDLETEAFDKFN
jgi:hypothetical protein